MTETAAATLIPTRHPAAILVPALAALGLAFTLGLELVLDRVRIQLLHLLIGERLLRRPHARFPLSFCSHWIPPRDETRRPSPTPPGAENPPLDLLCSN